MNKLLVATLLVLPLAACDFGPKTPTVEDTKIVLSEMEKQPGKSTIVALGAQGDYLLKLEATEALNKVASMVKTTKILSADPTEHAADGVCLLNIIPNRTMAAMGMPENKCNYRLVCGAIADQSVAYAVELCEE